MAVVVISCSPLYHLKLIWRNLVNIPTEISHGQRGLSIPKWACSESSASSPKYQLVTSPPSEPGPQGTTDIQFNSDFLSHVRKERAHFSPISVNLCSARKNIAQKHTQYFVRVYFSRRDVSKRSDCNIKQQEAQSRIQTTHFLIYIWLAL
jgi:hypothetical protein